MKKYILIFLLCQIIVPAFGQSWIQIADFNRPPRGLFSDSIGGNLYIGGNFKWSGADTLNGVCFWDGLQIHKMKDGICDGGWNACDPFLMINRYRDKIYVGGPMSFVDTVPANGMVAWDGQNWSTVGDNSLLTHTNSASWVLSTLVHDDKLFTVGYFRTAGGDTCNSLALWDGEHWKNLGFPPRPPAISLPFLNAMAFYKNELYVGGNTENLIDGNFNMDIARFDGVKWKQVGNGLLGGFADVSDMVVYKDELYVCGYFRKIDGNTGNKIMRWDGQQWKEVGGGLCSPGDIPTDMMVYDGKLYVVGIFNCVGDGLPVSNIAVWDGLNWCSLGNSVFDNKLSCIAAYKGEIYVGGGFEKVDGQPCKYFAKWVGDHATDTCSTLVSKVLERPENQINIFPNPAGDALRIRLPQALGKIEIFNTTGQNLGGKISPHSSGDTETELDISQLPSGWYLLDVTLKDGTRISAGFVKK